MKKLKEAIGKARSISEQQFSSKDIGTIISTGAEWNKLLDSWKETVEKWKRVFPEKSLIFNRVLKSYDNAISMNQNMMEVFNQAKR